ncbi:hypothetical protein AS033_00800 [Exiguobacterium indicum]|uniref:BIG2 domain-containing protein n=1 Tax=Exiguobacterium indicum TaxID=296995 RepID=A0A0V8GIG7_9BACL|nr:hypothetical protein [Exiguobacterium enclense]KSU49937.1 hypothetical protein AS033_00800 [Exiguobacterium enclense]SDB86615.1 hypothetical protein SAMN05216342_0163 [Exiguobacterium enclense]
MKKLIVGLAATVLYSATSIHSSAEVKIPFVTSLTPSSAFQVVPDESRVWRWGTYEAPRLFDFEQARDLQVLSTEEGAPIQDFTVSDDQQRFVFVKDQVLEVRDATGNVLHVIDQIKTPAGALQSFTRARFFPDSHLLAVSAKQEGVEQTAVYDLDSATVRFVQETTGAKAIRTSTAYLAIIRETSVDVYEKDGTLAKRLTHPSGYAAYEMGREGTLVLAKANDRRLYVYDGAHQFKESTSSQFITGMTGTYKDIAVDESGKFIGALYTGRDGYFALFEKNGHRIETSLDRDDSVSYSSVLGMTKGARYLIANADGGERTNMYDGRLLVERPVALSIPSSFKEVKVGSPEPLLLNVTQADGKKKQVTAKVKWVSDQPTIASVSSGKLYGKKAGAYTLRASYGGYTATLKGKVIPLPKLSTVSDSSWLKRQKQAMQEKQGFEGSPRVGASYVSWTGTSGSLVQTGEKVLNGKWKGRHFVARYPRFGSQIDRIDLVTLAPSLEKRTLTKAEVSAVFGKPTFKETYATSYSQRVVEGKTTRATYAIRSIYEYRIGQVTCQFAFDAKGVARLIHVN